VPLVIYAILTQEHRQALHGRRAARRRCDAGLHAGDPADGGLEARQRPRRPACALAERLRALAAVAPVFGVFAVVIIGIYGGWANPTEAAAIGAAACGVLAVATGGMRWRGLLDTAWAPPSPPR
jgi:C4-dicarboxylate transporter DctM subunit